MKIKRTNGVASSTKVATPGRKAAATDNAKSVEAVSSADMVTLSEGALAAGGVHAVEQVTLDASSNGPMPDPRETSQAILDRELASVFKEIYL